MQDQLIKDNSVTYRQSHEAESTRPASLAILGDESIIDLRPKC